MINNDQIPGCVVPADSLASIAYNGWTRKIINRYYVLCGDEFEYLWIPTSGANEIPKDAVQGGQTKDGEPVYIGRVQRNRVHFIGRVYITDYIIKLYFRYIEKHCINQ
jgi:Protein of unknown function (DUF3421)